MNEDEKKQENMSDHDLLLRLDTKFDIFSSDVKKAADDTKERLSDLGNNKLEKEQFHQWQLDHAEKISLREQAIYKQIADNQKQVLDILADHTVQLGNLTASDAKQNNKMNYIAGALAALALLFSVVGPLITQFLAKLLKLN